MFYYTKEPTTDTDVLAAGIFTTDQPWQHTEEVTGSWQMLITMEGILSLETDGTRRELAPKELILIPQEMGISSCQSISENVRYLWIQFVCSTLQKVSHMELETGDDSILRESVLFLPVHETRINTYPLYSMGQHLTHLMQEGAVQQYKNACMDCILYEITRLEIRLLQQSAEERFRMQPIQEWIRMNALEKITARMIADHFGYNASYLSRKYKEGTGRSLTQEITLCRISHAKYMLANTNETIQEIAWGAGFNDAKYFMKIFRQAEGITPSEYRDIFS